MTHFSKDLQNITVILTGIAKFACKNVLKRLDKGKQAERSWNHQLRI